MRFSPVVSELGPLLWLALCAACGDDASSPRARDATAWEQPDAGHDAVDDASLDGPASEHDATTARDPSAEAGGPGFEAMPGLSAPAVARPIGDQHVVFATQLLARADGQSILAWTSYADPTFTKSTKHVQLFSADGALLSESPLAALAPDKLFLAADGELWGLRNWCDGESSTCFHRESSATPMKPDHEWTAPTRTSTRYELSWEGNVSKVYEDTLRERSVHHVLASADTRYALTNDGAYQLHGLTPSFAAAWSVELLPPVYPPELARDAPIDQLIRAGNISHQNATQPALVDGGVVVAAVVGRGSLAALNQARGLQLPLPEDPLCSDILLARVSAQGDDVRYWVVPTPGVCERIPKLAVVGQHAFVSSWVHRAKEPEPNDTHQYDIGISVVDLMSGATRSQLIDQHEDDMVNAIAPCGERACLAGVRGARSVDTGSTVTYGEGFILAVSAAGETYEQRLALTSERHSEILHLIASSAGLVFFATVDGPITHTGDSDRWLAYNRGRLGKLPW